MLCEGSVLEKISILVCADDQRGGLLPDAVAAVQRVPQQLLAVDRERERGALGLFQSGPVEFHRGEPVDDGRRDLVDGVRPTVIGRRADQSASTSRERERENERAAVHTTNTEIPFVRISCFFCFLRFYFYDPR